MDVDRLLLETLDDLETRTWPEASEYDLLRAAALLRELLLDASPLVHQVNRAAQIPLRFRFHAKPPEPGREFEIWLGLDPNANVDVPISVVGLKDFLGTPLVSFRRPGSPSGKLSLSQRMCAAESIGVSPWIRLMRPSRVSG